MKKIFYTLFCILTSISSCQNHQQAEISTIETINVHIDNKNSILNLIDDIEIIPLQTDTNCLISTFDKLEYYKDSELYLIFDNRQVISLFSKDGHFISNSQSMIGDGPQNYQIAVDAIYNSFNKCIEILSPYGDIYQYDIHFNFIKKKKINSNSLIFTRFFPINETQYILTPVIRGYEDAVIYIYDFNKEEISNPISYQNDCITTLRMNYNPFTLIDQSVFISPLCLNYYFYNIDIEKQKLTPYLKLDFGSNSISKKNLIRQFGNPCFNMDDRNGIEKNLKIINKMNSKLLNSNEYLPVIKMINSRYIYLYIIKGTDRITYIYDRLKKEAYTQTNNSTFKINFCLNIENNILTSIIQPYEIDNYLNTSIIPSKELEKLKVVKEDNNPIIVKYKLKEY